MLNAMFCRVGRYGERVGILLMGDGWSRVLGSYRSRKEAEYVANFLVNWLRDTVKNGIELTDQLVEMTFRNADGALRNRWLVREFG